MSQAERPDKGDDDETETPGTACRPACSKETSGLVVVITGNGKSKTTSAMGVVLRVIAAKPARVPLVLTGRKVAPEVIERADTVSEVCEIKHAYRKELESQPWID